MMKYGLNRQDIQRAHDRRVAHGNHIILTIALVVLAVAILITGFDP